MKSRNEPWNLMFHQILNSCKLKHEFPPSTLPKEYRLNKSCAHLLHVDLEMVARKCLYLTMFESLNKHHVTGLSYFIYTVIFRNPIWDIGFQHKLALQNNGKMFTTKLDQFRKYTSKCICPCSLIFECWHNREQLQSLDGFQACKYEVHTSPPSLVNHLYSRYNGVYHWIILRIIETNYSSLIAKLKMDPVVSEQEISQPAHTFSSIHQGIISLPSYVSTSSRYHKFTVQRYETLMSFLY